MAPKDRILAMNTLKTAENLICLSYNFDDLECKEGDEAKFRQINQEFIESKFTLKING